MVETAAHLVDYVIPRVPVRQWVVSFPIPLRILFAAHPDPLCPPRQAALADHSGPADNAAGQAAEHAHAYALGALTQAGFRDRYRTLFPLRRPLKDYRHHRGSPVMVRILAHLGLPTRAPPRTPVQRVDLFQAA
jgi:hypothetical protein